jgi:hypothetical protein
MIPFVIHQIKEHKKAKFWREKIKIVLVHEIFNFKGVFDKK